MMSSEPQVVLNEGQVRSAQMAVAQLKLSLGDSHSSSEPSNTASKRPTLAINPNLPPILRPGIQSRPSGSASGTGTGTGANTGSLSVVSQSLSPPVPSEANKPSTQTNVLSAAPGNVTLSTTMASNEGVPSNTTTFTTNVNTHVPITSANPTSNSFNGLQNMCFPTQLPVYTPGPTKTQLNNYAKAFGLTPLQVTPFMPPSQTATPAGHSLPTTPSGMHPPQSKYGQIDMNRLFESLSTNKGLAYGNVGRKTQQFVNSNMSNQLPRQYNPEVPVRNDGLTTPPIVNVVRSNSESPLRVATQVGSASSSPHMNHGGNVAPTIPRNVSEGPQLRLAPATASQTENGRRLVRRLHPEFVQMQESNRNMNVNVVKHTSKKISPPSRPNYGNHDYHHSKKSLRSSEKSHIKTRKIAEKSLADSLDKMFNEVCIDLKERYTANRVEKVTSPGGSVTTTGERPKRIFIPKCIIWVCGPPGCAKSELIPAILDHCSLPKSAFINAQEIGHDIYRRKGVLDGNDYYKSLMMNVLNGYRHRYGIVVDGFLLNEQEGRVVEFLGKKLKELFSLIRFVLIVIKVDEKTSVERQLTGKHGKKTNITPQEATQKYRQAHRDIQEMIAVLKKSFSFQEVNANGTPEQVRQNVIVQIQRQMNTKNLLYSTPDNVYNVRSNVATTPRYERGYAGQMFSNPQTPGASPYRHMQQRLNFGAPAMHQMPPPMQPPNVNPMQQNMYAPQGALNNGMFFSPYDTQNRAPVPGLPNIPNMPNFNTNVPLTPVTPITPTGAFVNPLSQGNPAMMPPYNAWLSRT